MFVLHQRQGAGRAPQGRAQQQQQQAMATRRGVIAHARTPSYYDVLGVGVDASADDIKAAYRRRAKELHPDVNDSADAAEAFKQVKAAYETLSDDESRAAYDDTHATRRMNFFSHFQDVDFEVEQQQQQQQQQQEGWGRPVDPFEVHRRMWAEDPPRTASTSGRDDGGGAGGDDDEDLLERLSRIMGGGGLNPYGTGGRLDPFGSSSSQAWARRVQEQTDNPGLGSRGRPLYGRGAEPGWGRPGGTPSEWDPFRPGDADDPFEKRQGWSNPARPEWQHPRRQWDEEEGGEAGGGRGGGRRGGEGFRGKPL